MTNRVWGRGTPDTLALRLAVVLLAIVAIGIAVPIIDPTLDLNYWKNVGNMVTVERGNETVRLTLQNCNNEASGMIRFYNATISKVVTNTSSGLVCSPFGSVCSLETPGVGCDNDTISWTSNIVFYTLSTCDIAPACDCYDRFSVNLDFGYRVCPYMVLIGDGPPGNGTFNLGSAKATYGSRIELDGDSDLDGICDNGDNCEFDYNPDQSDADDDWNGDVCDNCPEDANEDQQNSDGDSYGDVCDNCPLDDNEDQLDQDNDGYGAVCDCNDTDPSITGPLTWYLDMDGDGYGDPENPVLSCTEPEGHTNNSDDCDDTNASIHPGAEEACDGVDNDCDDNIDEDFPDLGDTCWSGGIGACNTQGEMVCTADGTGTECDAVPGEPTDEVCDTIDNDCDGETDEDFPDLGDTCWSGGIGACNTQGKIVCTEDKTDTECNATEGEPTDEICDNIDNDCDNETDENLTDQKSCGVGVCAGGEQSGVCVDGDWEWSACSTDNLASPEVCTDDLDNDCDGKTDCDDSDCSSHSACRKGRSRSSGGDSHGFIFTGTAPSYAPIAPEKNETKCNCTDVSAEISEMEAGDTVNITITKLDDCEWDYALLVTEPHLVGEEIFRLSKPGQTKSFTFSSKSDWVEMKARLYCKETYEAGNIDDYIDIKIITRELPQKTVAETRTEETKSPTGLAIGTVLPWFLGFLLLLLALIALRRMRRR